MSMAMQDRPRRSHWIPWAFVGFFVVVLGANAAMVAFAFTSWTGVQTQEAYIQGLQFNDRLDEAAAQRALGWTVDVSFAQTGPLAGRLRVHPLNDSGTPVHGATVTAQLIRPTRQGFDFTIAVPRVGDAYDTAIDFPLAGVWDLKVLIESSQTPYRYEERLFLRP